MCLCYYNLILIYKMYCEECVKVYIGKTGGKITKKVNEHENSLIKKDWESLLGKHANDECHKNVNLEQKFEQLKIMKQKGRNNHCN